MLNQKTVSTGTTVFAIAAFAIAAALAVPSTRRLANAQTSETPTPTPTTVSADAATTDAAAEPAAATQVAAAAEAPFRRTVTVVGMGRASAAPDIARVTLGADVISKSLSAAVSDVNQRTTAITAALREQGVEDRDIRTAEFNVFPQQEYGPNGPGPITGYRVVNLMRVTIRDLDKAGDILEQAVAAGANNVQGLTFTIEDARPVEAEARRDAMADARFKAEALAGDAGVQVGPVLTISEIVSGGGPIPLAVMQAAEGMGGGGVSVSPGMQDVSVQVQVTYALE
jgi:uncharacterized protein YggE